MVNALQLHGVIKSRLLTPVHGDRTKVGMYEEQFHAFMQTLKSHKPEWLSQLRHRSIERFAELGFPTAQRGNEAWKYTNVSAIARATFTPAPEGKVTATAIAKLAFWDKNWTNLVFVNGRFSKTLSSKQAGDIYTANLADAVTERPELVEQHLGKYAEADKDAFIALNTAFLRDGAFVYVPADTAPEAPIHLVFVTTKNAGPTVTHPRSLVVAGNGSKVRLLESYVTLDNGGSYFTNAVTEVYVGNNATVEHCRFMVESPTSYHIGVTRAYQAQGCHYTSVSFSTGSAIGRNDIHAELDAPGSTTVLNGLYMTTGKEHLDNSINIDHVKPHCTSHEYYKGILSGESRAVFSGRVVVHQGAQKTDATQEDKNLILSEGAEADSKPSLEILADDVKCKHGATAGQIDTDTLFYMRARGLDVETAGSMLIHAFANEIINTVPMEQYRNFLREYTEKLLPKFKLEAAL